MELSQSRDVQIPRYRVPGCTSRFPVVARANEQTDRAIFWMIMDAIILVNTDPWESNKLFGGFGEGSYKSKSGSKFWTYSLLWQRAKARKCQLRYLFDSQWKLDPYTRGSRGGAPIPFPSPYVFQIPLPSDQKYVSQSHYDIFFPSPVPESQSLCPKSHFPRATKGQSQLPFYPFRTLLYSCLRPILSDSLSHRHGTTDYLIRN